EQPRRGAVTEQVVQGLSVHNDFELRHEIDDRRSPLSQKLLQSLPGRRLEVGVRTGVVVEIGNDRDEQSLAGRDCARSRDRPLSARAGKEPDRARLARRAVEFTGLQGRELGQWERVSPTPPLCLPLAIAQAVGSCLRRDNSWIRIPVAPNCLARLADDQTYGEKYTTKGPCHVGYWRFKMRCSLHVFIAPFCFSFVCFGFHRSTAGNPARYNAESFDFFCQPRMDRNEHK